jgi:hypothetical protein
MWTRWCASRSGDARLTNTIAAPRPIAGFRHEVLARRGKIEPPPASAPTKREQLAALVAPAHDERATISVPRSLLAALCDKVSHLEAQVAALQRQLAAAADTAHRAADEGARAARRALATRRARHHARRSQAPCRCWPRSTSSQSQRARRSSPRRTMLYGTRRRQTRDIARFACVLCSLVIQRWIRKRACHAPRPAPRPPRPPQPAPRPAPRPPPRPAAPARLQRDAS